MSENTRIRRTPAEILAAKEADLVNAKARAAVDAQMSHPTVVNLTGLITSHSKARTEAKKGYNGNPNQTFANRIQSHTLWNEEIKAEKEVADAQIALSDALSPMYRDLRIKVATALANGENVSEMVTSESATIEADAMSLYAEVNDAKAFLAIQTANRKAFLESKKAGKAEQVATA